MGQTDISGNKQSSAIVLEYQSSENQGGKSWATIEVHEHDTSKISSIQFHSNPIYGTQYSYIVISILPIR
jgi:hypothetical protein